MAVWLIFGAGWFLWQRREVTPLDAIVIADGAVMVRNQSGRDWQSVRIWVNEHYAGGTKVIPAGGFVREPLSRFVAAQGQKINVARTKITSVVVLAQEPDGKRVRIVWGTALAH